MVSRTPKALAASLLTLLLPACGPPITETDAKLVAERIGHIQPSKRDTCETQAAIAAQSSRIDSILKDKEVVYKPAPCQKEAPAKVASR